MDEAAALDRRRDFRLVTWLWLPVQSALLVWGLGVVSSGLLGRVEQAGLLVSLGTVAGGLGITFAHELIHRPGWFERALGDVLLAMVSYPHFALEHVHGHHRHVGTPADPATARLGEG